MRRKGDIVLRILTFYRPCKSANGTSLVYAQHLFHFNATGRFQCPRNALMDDLKQHIKEWKMKGEQIMIMGDINEYIHSNSISAFFDNLDMREFISERHGKKGVATTQSNKSRQAIDGLLATLG
eukprot:1475011-Ditylum_brightwellii.AAC.1